MLAGCDAFCYIMYPPYTSLSVCSTQWQNVWLNYITEATRDRNAHMKILLVVLRRLWREPAGKMVVWVTDKELTAECGDTSVSSVCDSDELLVPFRIIDHDVPSAWTQVPSEHTQVTHQSLLQINIKVEVKWSLICVMPTQLFVNADNSRQWTTWLTCAYWQNLMVDCNQFMMSVIVMWWSCSKSAFIECEFQIPKFVEFECECRLIKVYFITQNATHWFMSVKWMWQYVVCVNIIIIQISTM